MLMLNQKYFRVMLLLLEGDEQDISNLQVHGNLCSKKRMKGFYKLIQDNNYKCLKNKCIYQKQQLRKPLPTLTEAKWLVL